MKTLTRRFTLPLLILLFAQPTHAQPVAATAETLATTALGKMQNEHLSAQQVWDKGILNWDVVFYLLNDPWRLDNDQGMWRGAAPENDALSALLLKYTPEDQKNRILITSDAAIRIALYRIGQGDNKGADSLAETLDALPRENASAEAADAVIYNLSAYYLRTGQPGKSVDTSLRMRDFTNSPTDLANSLLPAARVSWDMGDKDTAMALYYEIIGYGYGWATGRAYLDIAHHKFDEGKLEEGRALLKTPYEGKFAEQSKVMVNSTLAESYEESGEWAEAAHWSQVTIDGYSASGRHLKGYGLEDLVASAEMRLIRLKNWDKNALQAEPAKLEVVPKTGAAPILIPITIHAFAPVTPTGVSPDANIKIIPVPRTPAKPYRTVSFQIEIAPQAFGEDRTVELTFTAPALPGAVLKLPIHLQKTEPAAAH